MINAPVIPVDHLWYADHGLTLTGQTVRRWHPHTGKNAFLEQVEEAARPRLILSGKQPVIRFDGKRTHLFFRAFGAAKGPHTFLFACRLKSGLLLDSQHGGPTIQSTRCSWQIFETIQDTDVPINGETALGSNYYGNADFLKGDITAIAYKNGILPQGQRDYIYNLMEKRLGEAEKGFWIIHIPKPVWWPSP